MKLKNQPLRVHDLLRFEHLLSDVSTRYINLPSERIEHVIKTDLGRLGKLLKADRCMLFLRSEDDQTFRFELPFVWWPETDNAVVEGDIELLRSDPHFFDRHQFYSEKWQRGEVVQVNDARAFPEGAQEIKNLYERFHTKSVLSIPISIGGSTMGALFFATIRKHRSWPAELIPRLRLFGEVFVNAMGRKRSEEKLQAAFTEIRRLKEKIEADYAYLREESDIGKDFRGIIGKSEALTVILLKVKQIARTNVTTLLLGETGTGKGLIARAIHEASTRKERPLIQVNCATLAPTLIESELFGHEKGAFSGAVARRIGRFELADGSTLFLDEIGELPLELQAKLLRILQDGEFERVGGSVTLRTDVRLIAATNRDLEKEAKAGKFRADLWYRLSVFPISIPPLRKRLEDIPLFVDYFVEKYGKWMGKRFDVTPEKTIRSLQTYHWPGNIRELENVIERAVITSPPGKLHVETIGASRPEGRLGHAATLEEVERQHIIATLAGTRGRINGPNGAAEYLGLHPETLRSRMRKLRIRRPTS
jgi:formate hydrogenlyase transcriptional activator